MSSLQHPGSLAASK
jgi:hypothetical protein